MQKCIMELDFFLNGLGFKSKNQQRVCAHVVFLFKCSLRSSTASHLPVFGTCDLLQFSEAAQLLQAQPRRVGHKVPEK